MTFLSLIRTNSSSIMSELVSKCAAAGWEINDKKSIIIPVKRIRFLGAVWGNGAICRDPYTTSLLVDIWRHIRVRQLSGKILQRVRGFFTYYLSFAGRFFSVVNRILKRPNKFVFDDIFFALLSRGHLPLRVSAASNLVHFASDATLSQAAALCLSSPSLCTIKRLRSSSIIVNEIEAAFLCFPLFLSLKPPKDTKLVLHVDNMAAVAFLNKGRANYSSLSIRAHYELCMKLHTLSQNIFYHATYIHTSVNPADALSRKSL